MAAPSPDRRQQHDTDEPHPIEVSASPTQLSTRTHELLGYYTARTPVAVSSRPLERRRLVTHPQRIQLRRTRGSRKPTGAIVVARPTKFGNPFTVADALAAGYEGTPTQLRALCTDEFREWLRDPDGVWSHDKARAQWILDHLGDLRGHDLACWCPLDEPCHADVLLEIANP